MLRLDCVLVFRLRCVIVATRPSSSLIVLSYLVSAPPQPRLISASSSIDISASVFDHQGVTPRLVLELSSPELRVHRQA